MIHLLASSLSALLCLIGMSLSIYILINKKIDTSLLSNNLILCFFGLGWLSLAMESFQDLSFGSFVGVLCFFTSFMVWAQKLHLERDIKQLLQKE